MLAALFANDTWGGTFDWLAMGEAITKFDVSTVATFLSNHDPSTKLFLGTPRDACPPNRARDPFACCATEVSCPVDVPPHKPYFSFEWNASTERLEPAPCRRRRRDLCGNDHSTAGAA